MQLIRFEGRKFVQWDLATKLSAEHICGLDRMPGQVQLLMESMPLIVAFAQKHNLQILPQASATDFGDSLCSQFQEAAGRHQRHCTSMFRAKVKLI